MDGLTVMRRLAHNDAWANHRLHAAVARLTPQDYRRADRTSFFPSIHLTLSHLLYVAWFYVDALVEGGRGQSLWADNDRCDREGTFDEVTAAQHAVDRRLIDWLDGPVDLDAECRIERRDRVQVDIRANVLLHLFEHQLHHRGQVHAMLSGTPVKPPQLDEFFLADELPLRETELREIGLPLR